MNKKFVTCWKCIKTMLVGVITLFISSFAFGFVGISMVLFFLVLFNVGFYFIIPNINIPFDMSYSNNQFFYNLYFICGVIWLIDRALGVEKKFIFLYPIHSSNH